MLGNCNPYPPGLSLMVLFPTNELVVFVINDPSSKLIISPLAIRTRSNHCLIQFIIGIYVLNVLEAIEFEIDSLKCKIALRVPKLLNNYEFGPI